MTQPHLFIFVFRVTSWIYVVLLGLSHGLSGEPNFASDERRLMEIFYL